MVETTYETYEEAYKELTKYDEWGVLLKHEPITFGEERPKEEVVYEHLPEKK